jgi:hypothetical protein
VAASSAATALPRSVAVVIRMVFERRRERHPILGSLLDVFLDDL